MIRGEKAVFGHGDICVGSIMSSLVLRQLVDPHKTGDMICPNEYQKCKILIDISFHNSREARELIQLIRDAQSEEKDFSVKMFPYTFVFEGENGVKASNIVIGKIEECIKHILYYEAC